MRNIVILILVLGIGIILQLTIISRINILNGSGDLILVIVCAVASQEKTRYIWLWVLLGGLLVGTISAAPWYLFIGVYFFIIAISKVLIRRTWQAPLLAMFLAIFLGSLLANSVMYFYRFLFENLSQPIGDMFVNILLPSTLLNLFLIILIRPIIGNMIKWANMEATLG